MQKGYPATHGTAAPKNIPVRAAPKIYVLTPSQMIGDMLIAQEQWLPQYKDTITAAKKRRQEVNKTIDDTDTAADIH